MHQYRVLARCLIIGLGLVMAAFAADRVVVCEYAYSEG
jgi:hypothetical protein